MIRVLLADNQGVMRAGLRALIQAEEDMEVVGEAASSEAVMRLADTACPDVVLTEVNLPGIFCTDLIHCLKDRHPTIHVLALTYHQDDRRVLKTLQAGARGYFPKQGEGTDLLWAIRSVARGEMYVHPTLMPCLIYDEDRLPEITVDCPYPTLSNREVEVLRLLVQGYTNRQVARELDLGVRTVETHRANLMEKVGVRSRAELVKYAATHGLLLGSNGSSA